MIYANYMTTLFKNPVSPPSYATFFTERYLAKIQPLVNYLYDSAD